MPARRASCSGTSSTWRGSTRSCSKTGAASTSRRGSEREFSSRVSPTCWSRPGVGERMQREGVVHHGIGLQFDGERHRIPLYELTGKGLVIYGQTEIVKDLIAARLATDRPLLFEVAEVSVAELDTDRPRIRFRHEGGCPGARVRRDRRLRRLPRRLPAEHPCRRADGVLARVPVRLARDPGGGHALDRRGRLLRARARIRDCSACAPRSSRATTSSAHRTRTPRAGRTSRSGRSSRRASASRAGRSRKARCWRRASPGCAATSSSRCSTAACSWPATPPTSSPRPGRRA